MKTTYVYVLEDPRDGQLKYVGITSNPKARIKDHLKKAHKGLKWKWVRELKASGLAPCMMVFQELNTSEEAKVAEIYWIAFFKERGCSLLNGTGGGDGIWGRKAPPEERRIRSLEMKKKWADPDFRTARSLSLLGHCVSEETRRKISKSHIGKNHTNETKERIRKLSKIQFSTLEARIKTSRAKGGRAVLCSDGRRFETASEAARQCNVFPGNLNKVLRGSLKSTGGLGFSYVD